jgi:hypothetical protein
MSTLKRLTQRFFTQVSVIFVAASIVGCAGAGEGAVKGAAGGALAGAASGLVSSLIWGGDPAYHMARGATVGATVGAIGGAVEGSSRARAEQDRQQAYEQQEIDQFRRDIGNDAFDGVVALAECKHEVAIANAKAATKSTNGNHALAGLWVQALTLADQDAGGTELDPVVSEIIRWDRAVNNEADVERELRSAHDDLLDIRTEYHLQRECGA